MSRKLLNGCCLGFLLSLGTSAVAQTTSTITQYPLPKPTSSPGAMTLGPDGALWFVEARALLTLGRITTSGSITEFPLGAIGNTYASNRPSALAVGPDGNVWICYSLRTNGSPAYTGAISQVNLSGEVLHTYLPNSASELGGIATASDNALWFTETQAGRIGRLTAAGAVTDFAVPALNSQPSGIAAGSDGALWFTDPGNLSIGRITISQAFDAYPLPSAFASNLPQSIVAGPDGALWFTAPSQGSSAGLIGRINTTGTYSAPFAIPEANSNPETIAAGPDGQLWFTDQSANQIDSLSTNGTFTQYQLPTSSSGPLGIAAGPDTAMWFTESTGNQIGRLGIFYVSQSTLPAATTSHSYSATLSVQPAASGTVWSIAAGILPDGLSLNAATGQISGTPLTAGNLSFNVRAANAAKGLVASRALTMAVTGLPSFTEFPALGSPGPITQGPDGGMWFTEGGSEPKIARADSTGSVSQFAIQTLSGTTTFGGMAAGPDGNLWFTCWQTAVSYVGKVSVSGQVTLFQTITFSSLGNIAPGPDGALWFTERSANKIGRITTGGSVSEYALLNEGSGPSGITVGPDDAMWFTETSGGRIGRITTAEAITEFAPGSNLSGSNLFTPESIVAGPDGALWFTSTSPSLIGRLTTSGAFSYFAGPPNSQLATITIGPDGNLWFVDAFNNQVDSITTGGTITQHSIPTNTSAPEAIALGADGAIWITEQQGQKVARLAVETTFREYPTQSANSKPGPIATGPDGALWFAEQKVNLQLGRVTTTGTMSEYAVPASAGGANSGNQIGGITQGADGNLWYTVTNPNGNSFVVSVTTAGAIKSIYPTIVPSTLGGITTGPDNAIWFTAGSANLIGRIAPDGSETDFFIPTAGCDPTGIAPGPDGALWFTETSANQIGRITTEGSVSEFALPAGMQGPLNIISATNNSLYFTLSNGQLGTISSDGRAISSFSALSAPSSYGIAVGPDRHVWFADPGNNQIHQLGGSAYSVTTGSSLPSFLTLGPDGALWFTEYGASKVGRLGIPVIQPVTFSSGTVGSAFSATEKAIGGTAPYTWSIADGSLPAGLTLNQTSGVISGTPSALGSFTFDLTVTDAGQPQNVHSDQSQTIEVQGEVTAPAPNLSISSATTGVSAVGSTYTFAFAAQGGTAPYVWTAGGLPAGLSLTAAGVLSGIPSQAGTYSIVLQVTDSGAPLETATQTFTLIVNPSVTSTAPIPALTIATATLPPGIAGAFYSTNLAAQGGTAPYSWIATGLPAGLTLNANGTLSGTPAQTGGYMVTVKVTDASSPALTVTQRYSLTIAPSASSPQSVMSITGLPSSATPQQTINAGLQLAQAYATDLTGSVTLVFLPEAADLPTPYMNPGVCFTTVSSCAATPQMTTTFTIPAGSTVFSLPSIQTGTVAGTITLTVTTADSTSVTASVPVPASVPVIEADSVQITAVSNTAFQLELVAESTPRDLQSATFTFNAAYGTQLTGPTTFTIDLAPLLAQWYSSSEGQSYGSLFALTVPFSLSGSTSAIGSVSVTLTNSVGTSAPAVGSQ